MQNETYDIEKVKEYFLWYIFNWDVKDPKQFTDITWVIPRFHFFGWIIWIIVWTLYGGFLFWIFYRDSIYLPLFFLISSIYPLVIFYAVYKIFRFTLTISNYLRSITYFPLKSRLIPFLENFQKSVNKDLFTEWIDTVEIEDIQKSMGSISKLLSLVTWPLIAFRQIWSHLPGEARNILERFISIETRWISDYIREFRYTLSVWMEAHKAELSEYQRRELEAKNEAIYSLASSRLTSHMENLEKVSVRL